MRNESIVQQLDDIQAMLRQLDTAIDECHVAIRGEADFNDAPAQDEGSRMWQVQEYFANMKEGLTLRFQHLRTSLDAHREGRLHTATPEQQKQTIDDLHSSLREMGLEPAE